MDEKTMTDIKKDLKRYIKLVKNEDVAITYDDKPHVKLVNASRSKVDILNKLAGSIMMEKSYEELMEERYSKI